MQDCIGVAVVGAGYWGHNYVRNFASMDSSRLLWVCDRDPGARERASRIAPSVRVTDSLDQVLADPEVEAVVIATNATLHHAHAMAALSADKHVLVEKPMATAVDDAEQMVREAGDRNKTLMVGHLMVYHPAVERLSRMVSSGELGDIYYLYALRVNLGRIRDDENALWSFGPHDLSMIQLLLDQTPESVAARGQSYLRAGVEDVVFVNLAFGDRTMAQIQLSWLDPRKERRLTVVGSKRMVVFDDAHASEKLRIYDKGVDRPPEYETYGDYLSLRQGGIQIPHINLEEPLNRECRHFLHCVKTGQKPRSCGREGLAVTRVLTAAAESLAAGGRPVCCAPGKTR